MGNARHIRSGNGEMHGSQCETHGADDEDGGGDDDNDDDEDDDDDVSRGELIA